MKRLVVFAAAFGFALTACTSAPTGLLPDGNAGKGDRSYSAEREASNDDDVYMGILASGGVLAPRESSVEVGRQVCDALDRGMSVRLLAALAMDSGFTSEQAATIIAAAIVVYCPWNESKVSG